MLTKSAIFVLVCLSLAAIPDVSAIRCYFCSGITYEACKEPDVSQLTAQTCESQYTHCIKAGGTIGGAAAYLRGCSVSNACELLTQQPGFETFSDCHVCNGDLCNGSTTVKASFGITTLLILFYGLKQLIA